MDQPLLRRKKLLQKVVRPSPGRLEVVPGELLETLEQIESTFSRSMEAGEEGIILKRLDSTYIPHDRTCHWFKLKGDYVEGLTDSMDLLVIAGYYGDKSYRTGSGSGDATEHLTRFLLGVIDHADQAAPGTSRVTPFCKVGTGYSAAELAVIRNKLRPAWQARPPSFVNEWHPSGDDVPDFWVSSP
jgi:ATP-dependent DNA ligase